MTQRSNTNEAEQLFAGLVQVMKEQGTALKAITEQLANMPQTKNAIVSHNITFEKFEPREEDFSAYLERFDNFLRLRGLKNETGTETSETEEMKKSILLGCLNRTEFLELKLDTKQNPINTDYGLLVEMLKKRYDTKINVHTQRHKFLSCIQSKGESLSEYISNLKNIAQKCNWTCQDEQCKTHEEIFLAQFIRGTHNGIIREKLLQLKSETTLDRALDFALAMEAAHKENTEEFSKEGTSTSVYAINNHRNYETSSASFRQYKQKKNSPGAHRKKTNRQFLNEREQNQLKNKDYSSDSSCSTTSTNSARSYFSRKARRQEDTLRKFQLQNKCLSCGKMNHRSSDCRIRHRLKCAACGKKYHIAEVCIKTKRSLNQLNDTNEINKIDWKKYTVYDIHQTEQQWSKKIFANVKIEGKVQRFEVDTGSPVTILARKDFRKLKIRSKLIKDNTCFRAYNQQAIFPDGHINLPVEYEGRKAILKLYIVQQDYAPILGRVWIRHLNILKLPNEDTSNETNIDTENISQLNRENTIDYILKKFANVFKEEIGAIPNVKVNLQLTNEAKPVYKPPRPVPYALQERVEQELNILENQGIITKTDFNEWGTPLVIVPKSNGKVRLCADYKITVNPQLQPAHFPIPRVEEIFHKLQGSTHFCILDIHKAYLHIELDHESSKIAALSTHRGSYLVNRLFFGLSTAPSIFHAKMTPIINALEGCAAYFDDIIIYGKTREECNKNLIACLKQMEKHNIHLNKEKSKFFEKKVKYLGHIISKKGLEKDKEKVKAMLQAPAPKNVPELQSFLGMTRFYASFIPDAATLLQPLHNLLKNNVPFIWSRECQCTFEKIKKELASERILVTYNAKLPLYLETDASPHGLGAVLSHKIDGILRPISYISRTLTKSERRYSHLDKEATAIFWAVKKLYQYLYGRHFTLITDNKPLKSIFDENKNLPSVTALRLMRYAIFLRQFEYTIQYRNGKENQNADFLSRASLEYEKDENDSTAIIYDNAINLLTTCNDRNSITEREIRKETEKDPELNKLKEILTSEKQNETEFAIHKGIIMRGTRVVVPQKLQKYVLNELHSAHSGIVKMKMLARSTVFWKNIDKDIEQLVRTCRSCALTQNDPKKAPLHHWEPPNGIWQRVHIDFAGPIDGIKMLIVTDALTKWVEIGIFKKAPTSSSTIKYLKDLISHHGIMHTLVSDNEPLFKSYEFENFCKSLAIDHRISATYHPATNGQVERTVQIIKKKLKALNYDKTNIDFEEKIHHILFQYRITPLEQGKSPAELHLGRSLRSKLDLLKPHENETKYERRHVHHKHPNKIRQLQIGQRVLSRNYVGPTKWKLGTIIEKLGHLHYHVRLDNKVVIKRHIDQLKRTEVLPTIDDENELERRSMIFKKQVTFETPQPRRHDKQPIIYENILQEGEEIQERRDGNIEAQETREGYIQITKNNEMREQRQDINENNMPLRRSVRVKKPVVRLNL